MFRLIPVFWSEPRPATVPRNRLDGWLFALLVGILLIEVLVRDDLVHPIGSFLVGMGLASTVLWRRSKPLLMVGLAFTITGVLKTMGILSERPFPDLQAIPYLLILPYALFRWGSGREALLGLPIIFASATICLVSDDLTVGEVLGGLAVLLSPVAVGTAIRYREVARRLELVDVRSSERLTLARELHDTIAHHVSAIAVRSRSGIDTAAEDPEAAMDALQAVRDEASSTLSEMREIVRVLRDDEDAELAPAPRLQDLQRLDDGSVGSVPVEVVLAQEVMDLTPALSGAIYRIAQESITNAQRHAANPTNILVQGWVEDHVVVLEVLDDGGPVPPDAKASGYGLLGMEERAQLLGGTLEAGPAKTGGWKVRATIPSVHPGVKASA